PIASWRRNSALTRAISSSSEKGFMKMADADDAQTVHRIVEATKRAFALRDAHITDPRHLDVDVQQLLTPEALQPLADSIDDASA
ncbi:gamma-glutamyltransferase, partial [Klebsiella pneumoniae]